MVAVLVFILLLFSASAQAANYWASTTGGAASCAAASGTSDPGQYRTLVQGFACLGSGDTLYLKGGTYNTPLLRIGPSGSSGNAAIVHIPIVSGTSWSSPTTIASAPGETATLHCSTQCDGSLSGLLDMPTGYGTQYLVFDRLRIDGAGYINGAGYISGDYAFSIIGIGGSHIRFSNNEILNAPDGYFVQLAGGGPIDHQFINNVLHDSYPYASAGGTGCGQAICWGYAWYWGSKDGLIEGNDVSNFPSYGIHMYSQLCSAGDATHCPNNNIVRNNRFHNFADTYWPGPPSGAVAGGDSRGIAILLTSGSNNLAYNNVIYGGSSGVGTTTSGSAQKFYNNTISNMTEACALIVNGDTSTLFTNNICAGSVPAQGYMTDQGVPNSGTYSNNLCQSGACPKGTGNHTGDPLFVNAGSDFSLQSSSPARDIGTDLSSSIGCTAGSTCLDIAGIIRPQNSIWDLGAYEYQTTAIPQTDMLVASYGFEENTGTTFADTSGQSNNGSFGSGVTWQSTGKYGHALHFDGTGGATIADSSSLDVSTGFTLEAWAKPTSLTGDTVLIVKNPNSTYHLFASLTDSCGTDMPAGGHDGNVACRAAQLTTGIWNHVAVTYSATTGIVSLYIDGMSVGTAATSGNVPASAGTLQIGTSGFSENFIGDIDEVRVYNYPRSVEQIIADMATPVVPDPLLVAGYGFGGTTSTVMDVSPFNNSGTFGTGAVRASSKTGFGQALNFTAGTMTVPGSVSLGDTTNGVTLEAWVNRNNSTASWQGVFYRTTYWMFASSTGACSEGAVTAGALISSVVSTVCSGSITSGVWVHLALTYHTATGVMKLYKDGVVVDSATYSGTIDSGGYALLLGNSAVSEFCQCKIDDARVYNYALSQAAIQADMIAAISEGLPAAPTGFKLK